MAILKAPLFSLGASGALGKALVFFGWKGLDVVREYVVPANPKTTAQRTQRGYLGDAVDAVHAAQALDVEPLAEADNSAYSLWGSVFATPRTWFNQVVKNWIDVMVAEDTPTIYRGGASHPGSELLHPAIYSDEIDGTDITAGKFFYGASKTALVNSIAATITAGIHEAAEEISGLTAGVKYFWQFRPDTGENCEGAWSGIYYGVPTA